MLLLLLLCIATGVIARGPPGIIPPLSFHAEEWYPPNLPTVKPPWQRPSANLVEEIVVTLTPKNNLTPISSEEKTNDTLSPPEAPSTTTPIPKLENSAESNVFGFEFSSSDLRTLALKSTELLETTESTQKMNETEMFLLNLTSTESSSLEELPPIELTDSQEEAITVVFNVSESVFDLEQTTTSSPTTRLQTTKKTQKERLVFDNSSDISAFSNENRECSDILFVIDSSGNVKSQFEKQKKLVREIVRSLGEKSRRFGLVTYASKTNQRWNIPIKLNISNELFLKKLERARYLGGMTETGAVLSSVAKVIGTNETTVILITDGFSFDNVQEPAQALRSLENVEVLVTGDYFPVMSEVLLYIAGGTHNAYFGRNHLKRITKRLKC